MGEELNTTADIASLIFFMISFALGQLYSIYFAWKNWNNKEVASSTILMMLFTCGTIAPLFMCIVIPLAILMIPYYLIVLFRDINE